MAWRTTSWFDSAQGRGGADADGGVEGAVDRAPHLLGIPPAGQEVEVERLVVLVGSQVEGQSRRVHPGLGHHHEIAANGGLGLVEHGAPFADDLVHAVAIPERVRSVGEVLALEDGAGDLEVGEVRMLHEAVGDVDAEAVDTEVDPEAEDVLELGAHLGVVPIEVGLADIEEMEVPLAVVETTPG